MKLVFNPCLITPKGKLVNAFPTYPKSNSRSLLKCSIKIWITICWMKKLFSFVMILYELKHKKHIPYSNLICTSFRESKWFFGTLKNNQEGWEIYRWFEGLKLPRAAHKEFLTKLSAVCISTGCCRSTRMATENCPVFVLHARSLIHFKPNVSLMIFYA